MTNDKKPIYTKERWWIFNPEGQDQYFLNGISLIPVKVAESFAGDFIEYGSKAIHFLNDFHS